MKLSLTPHPSTPSSGVDAVTVNIELSDPNAMSVEFRVLGSARLAIPDWAASTRRDGLWRTTCFEIFILDTATEGYREFNFSPSTEWAAYDFDGYRAGMRPAELAIEPFIERVREPLGDPETVLAVDVDLDLTGTGAGKQMVGLSAVIEEKDGTKSYWALKHPEGAPDFHDAACFVLELPAVG